jgi:hypothetical protein
MSSTSSARGQTQVAPQSAVLCPRTPTATSSCKYRHQANSSLHQAATQISSRLLGRRETQQFSPVPTSPTLARCSSRARVSSSQPIHPEAILYQLRGQLRRPGSVSRYVRRLELLAMFIPSRPHVMGCILPLVAMDP